jgi:antirestriction protein ArdC
VGAHVRKGESGTTVVFYKLHEVDAQPSDTDSAEKRLIPLLHTFTAFNVAQLDCLPSALTEPPKPAAWNAHGEAETLLKK